MIANDITKHTVYTSTDKVNFEFNHILSRLNVAVKTGITKTYGKKDKKVTIASTEYTVKVYNGDSEEYVLDGGTYKKLAGTPETPEFGTEFEKPTPYDENNWKAVQVDDETKPLTGIVKLTELAVVNLKTTGDFDEKGFTSGTANDFNNLIDPAVLKAGTDKRWNATTLTADAIIGVAFNNTDNIASFNATENAVATTGTVVTNNPYITGSSDAKNVLTDKYNYVYQGLVIPQTVAYNPCKLDGSDVTAATNGTSTPYLKITYTIDGDSKTQYYNLAQVMSNVEAQYTKKVNDITYNAYKTIGNGTIWENGGKYYVETSTDNFEETTTYVLFDGAKFFDPANSNEELFQGSDGKLYKTQDAANNQDETELAYETPTYVMCNATTKAMVPVLRKDVDPAAGECDYTFCEGWQHNLKININPAAIYFSADVFEWETWVPEYDFTIE